MHCHNLFVAIGVDNFGAGLRPLHGCGNDADYLCKWFSEQEDWTTLRFIGERATREGILQRIKGYQLGENGVEELNLVLFAATHGCIDRTTARTYLAMHGCGSRDFDSMLSAIQLREAVTTCCKNGGNRHPGLQCRVLLILDACRTETETAVVDLGAEHQIVRDIDGVMAEQDVFDNCSWLSCSDGEFAREILNGNGVHRGLFGLVLQQELCADSAASLLDVLSSVSQTVAERSGRRQRPSVLGQSTAPAKIRMRQHAQKRHRTTEVQADKPAEQQIPEVEILLFVPLTARPGESSSVVARLMWDRPGQPLVWLRAGRCSEYRQVKVHERDFDVTLRAPLVKVELLAFAPASGRMLRAERLIRFDEAPAANRPHQIVYNVNISATENGVNYVPDATIDAGHDQAKPVATRTWEGFALDVAPDQWRRVPGVECRQGRFGEEGGRALFDLTTGPGKLPLYAAVRMGRTLSIGRLHRGDDRRRNQSPKGADWHLGWQTQVVAETINGEPDRQTVLTKARRQMPRRAGCLSAEPGAGEPLVIENRENADPRDVFQLKRLNEDCWRLTVGSVDQQERLEIYREHCTATSCPHPWFWARRTGIDCELEDRVYLWLPFRAVDLGPDEALCAGLGEHLLWSYCNGTLTLLSLGDLLAGVDDEF